MHVPQAHAWPFAFFRSAIFDGENNRLVIFGGRTAERKRLNDVYYLDLETFTWYVRGGKLNPLLVRGSSNHAMPLCGSAFLPYVIKLVRFFYPYMFILRTTNYRCPPGTSLCARAQPLCPASTRP